MTHADDHNAVTVQGKDHPAGVQSVKDNFMTAFLMGNSYWPFVNVINFKFMPADKRVLLTSSAAVLYNTFLR